LAGGLRFTICSLFMLWRAQRPAVKRSPIERVLPVLSRARYFLVTDTAADTSVATSLEDFKDLEKAL
jgi:hypothetical protein